MFYDRLKNICDNKGTSVTNLLKTLNISTSKGTAWKNGSTPNSEIVKQIANYFSISTDYLLGNEQKNNSSEETSDEFENKITLLARNKGKQLSKEDKDKLIKIFESTLDTFLDSTDK